MIRMFAKLLKVLNSETDPSQLSLAFSFAMLSGFLPFVSPLNIVVILIVCMLRVNLSAYLLGTAFFSGIAYVFDPLLHPLGLALLSASSLEGLWTNMYNSTIWRVQKFNNSVVMGSFVFAVVFFIPLFLLTNLLIRKYRDTILAWIRKTRVMQMIKASDFYHYYETVSGWAGRLK